MGAPCGFDRLKYTSRMLQRLIHTVLALAIAAQVLAPSRLVASQFCNMGSVQHRSHCQTAHTSNVNITLASRQDRNISVRDIPSRSSLQVGADALAALPDAGRQTFVHPAEYACATAYRCDFSEKQADLLALHSRLNI